MENCTINGCTARRQVKGWCSGHYQRVRIHGHPKADVPLAINAKRRRVGYRGDCSIADCDREISVSKRAMCNVHYQRWRKHGDPEVFNGRVKQPRWINQHGYARVWLGDVRSEFEHRLVMERVLGRPLLPNENVHHLNGDRQDNRPENLELWNTSQPPGQRVTDKVEWARELLAQYAPHLLADA